MTAAQTRSHRLAQHVDEKAIREAIIAAEAGTTAKIHVTLSDRFTGSTLHHAMEIFGRLRLHQAPDRNGVLFFVAPQRREFAVVGDLGIHEREGQQLWDRVVTAVSQRIASGDLTAGLVKGIADVGAALRTHFPSEH
jgi:uncharacterized membrane protein